MMKLSRDMPTICRVIRPVYAAALVVHVIFSVTANAQSGGRNVAVHILFINYYRYNGRYWLQNCEFVKRKNFQKGIDKLTKLWYNIGVP